MVKVVDLELDQEELVDKVRMRKIREQEAHVRELEIEYKVRQEESKGAREELSLAIARLRMLIRGEVEDQGEFDFDGDDGDEPSEQSWDALLTSTKLVDAITLTKAQRKKFEDLGVITVRHFEQLRAAELPGIAGSLSNIFNESTADKLEDAVLDWLDRKRIERGKARGSAGPYDPPTDDESTDQETKPRTVGGRPVKGASK